MRTLIHDVSFAFRQLRQHHAYALTAILSMALGIGATAAVYSVLYGVLVNPYPYRDASRIAFIETQEKQGGSGQIVFTRAQARQLRRADSVADVLSERRIDLTLTGGDLPETVQAVQFSGNGFEFLGAPPMLGRVFTAAEAPEGAAPPPVAVISYAFWTSHFNADPAVVGKVLELNHAKYTIVGVTGPRFTWLEGDVYLPMPLGIDVSATYQTLVRLRPGFTPAASLGELDSLVRALGRQSPALLPRDSFQIKVESLNDGLLGQFKGTLFLLFIAVALLLLIGCGNVSILMLARGTARQQELAMRSALGASRQRLVRQLLTEAVLLSVCGGVLGMAIAYAAIHGITGLLPQNSIPHEVVIALNVPVLLFSTAVAVATGIAAGLWPALQFSNPALAALVQAGGTRSSTSRGTRMRSALLTGQIALTVLLLAGAGAAMRTFLEAYTAKLGFDPHHVLMMDVTVPEAARPTWEAKARSMDALVEKIKTTPGVSDATTFFGDTPPGRGWRPTVDLVGAPPDPSRTAGLAMVGSSFFSLLRIPLVEGRTMTEAEVLRGSRVAVISQTFARKYFPGSGPIGRQLQLPALLAASPAAAAMSSPGGEEPFEIVGVVGDVRNNGLHEPAVPQMYVSSSTRMLPVTGLLIHTTGTPERSAHAVEANMHAMDPDAAVSSVYSYDEFLSRYVFSYDRFISALFAVFSSVALGLAAIGLFSVVAYSVEQRTRELGIRIALGASRWNVLRIALSSTMWTTGIGLLLGIGLSVGLSDSFEKWTQSSMRSAGVLTLISLVLLLASAIACMLPARRATSIDPVDALRST